MLLLMVTYGLRAREVAALTLDDLDWKRDRLHVRERKERSTMPCSTIHSNNRLTTPTKWLKLRGRVRGRLRKNASRAAGVISARVVIPAVFR